MKRLNITLPDDLVETLRNFPNMSRFIAEAVKERLKKEKKEQLDASLIEGYQVTREEDKKLNQEWGDATLKGWS